MAQIQTLFFALVIDIKQFIYHIACPDHQEFDPITRNSFYEPIGFIVTLCNLFEIPVFSTISVH